MPIVPEYKSPLPESLRFLDPGIDPSGMAMPLVTRTPQLLERLATRGLSRIDMGLVRELAKTKPGSSEARTILELMGLTRGGGEPAAESFRALTSDIPLSPEGMAGIPSRVIDILRGARERYLGKAMERIGGGRGPVTATGLDIAPVASQFARGGAVGTVEHFVEQHLWNRAVEVVRSTGRSGRRVLQELLDEDMVNVLERDVIEGGVDPGTARSAIYAWRDRSLPLMGRRLDYYVRRYGR